MLERSGDFAAYYSLPSMKWVVRSISLLRIADLMLKHHIMQIKERLEQ